MGVLRQLGQLFWKNFVLRKREPHVLILEIIWPILIFAVVALIRYGAPPENKETCSYHERAMPSAGMIPFLQTTVCNLDNPCESPETIQKKQASANRLSRLVGNLQPYLSDAIDTIDTGVQLVNAIKKMNKDQDLTKTLGSGDYQVRKLLREPDKVKSLLVNDLKLMSDEVAEAFLNSSINIAKVLESIDYINFRGIVCNVTGLSEYLLFKQGVNISRVSKELCAIEDSKIPEITDAILGQLDIAAIIRAAKSLTLLTQSYELHDALEDMAKMVDLLFGTSSISSLIKHMPQLKSLPALMNNMPRWIGTLTQMKTFDTASIDSLVALVDPVIKDLAPNITAWRTTKQAINELKTIINLIGDGTGNVNWTEVFHVSNRIIDLLGGSDANIDLSVIQQFAAFPIVDFTNIIDALFSGNVSAIEQLPMSKSIEIAQNILELAVGKNLTMQMLGIYDAVLEMGFGTAQYISDLDTSIKDILNENVATVDAFKRLLQKGPNVTLAVIQSFLTPANLQDLFIKGNQYKVVCQRAVTDSLQSTEPALATELVSVLCNDNITQTFDYIMKKLKINSLQKELQEAIMTLDKTWRQTTMNHDLNMADLYKKQDNLTALITRMFHSSFDWKSIFESVNGGVDFKDQQWNASWTQLYSSMIDGSWSVVVLTVGPMLENTTMWTEVGPWVRTTETVMEYMVHMEEKMKEMSDKSSTMGKLMDFAVKYSPELIDAVSKLMMDPIMIQDIWMDPDPDVLFCQKHLLEIMGLPAYVPTEEMDDILCKTNWTAFSTDFMSTYDVSPMIKQVEKYFDKTSGVGSAPGFNWTKMVTTVKEASSMLSNPQTLVSNGPWNMIQKMDWARMGAAFEKSMIKVQNMTNSLFNGDPNGSVQSFLNVMQQIDSGLGNETTWKNVKNAVQMWNVYTKIMIKYLNFSQGINLQQYLFNISKTLEDYVKQSSQVLPDFIDVLTSMVLNPNKVIHNMLTIDWSKLCNGEKVTNMLSLSASSKLPAYEDYLCKLNWTVIYIEMMEQDPDIREYNHLLQQSMQPDKIKAVTVNWTEAYTNTLHYFDLISKSMSTHNIASENLFGNMIDMNRVNASWVEFVTALSTADQYNQDRINSMVDGIESLLESMTNSSGDNVTRMIMYYQKLYSYQMYTALQFTVKQLEYFNNTRPVDLRKYFNSNEMDKLLNILMLGPEYSDIAFNVIIDMMKHPQKINSLFNSMDHFCSDLTVFQSLIQIPTDVTTSPSVIQSRLCALNVNFTVLIEELRQSMTGLNSVLQAFMGEPALSDVMRVKSSMTAAVYEQMNKLIASLSTHPPAITLDGKTDWMNETRYVSQWNSFVKDFTNSLISTNIVNTLGNFEQPWLYAMVSSLSSLPQMKPILTYTGMVAELVTDSIKRNQETMTGSLKGFPELQKVMNLADKLPYLAQVFIFNSLFYSHKISGMVEHIIGGWDKFCSMDPSQVLVDVPQSNFTYKTFHTQLCAVNTTVFLKEAMEFQSIDTEGLATFNFTAVDSFNATEVVKQISDLMSAVTSTYSNTSMESVILPGYLNTNTWVDVMDQLSKVLNDPQYMSKLTESGNGIAMLMDYLANTSDPMIREQLNIYKGIYGVIGMFLDKFKVKNGSSVITIEDILGNAPETIKLWHLMVKPGVLETLLFSLNNPQFSGFLFSPNVTGHVKAFCSSGDDFGIYLTIPPNMTVDLVMLKTDFCKIDVTKIEKEMIAEFNVQQVFMENYNSSGGFKDMMSKYTEISNSIQHLITNPPQIDLPSRWMNGTFWLNILMKYSKMNQDPQNIMKSVEGFYELVDSLAAMNPTIRDQLKMNEIIYKIMDVILGKIYSSVNGTTLSIDSFFGNATETIKLWHLVQKPGVIETLFYSANTPQFQQLLTNTNVTAVMISLCHPVTGNLSDYFRVPDYMSINLAELKTDLCDIDFTKIESEMTTEFNFMEIIREIYNTSTVDWSGLTSNYQHIDKIINSLIKNPPMLDLPTRWLNTSHWLNLLTNYGKLLEQTASSPDNIAAFLPLLDALSKADPVIFQEIKFGEIAYRIMGILVDRIQNETVLNVGDFLGNGTALSKLWNLVKKPGIMEMLMFSVNTPQFSQLLMISNVTEALHKLCDTVNGGLDKYFTVPSHLTINLAQLQTEFCAIDITKIEVEMEAEYGFQKVISQIYNSSTIDWTRILKDYEKFANLITKWTMSPPTVNVPNVWMNESFWLNTLISYSESVQQPQQIIAQIKSFLQSIAPLLDVDPLRQYGLFLEAFIDVIYENMMKINSTDVTLENLAQKAPLLSEIVSTFNMSKNVLQTLITAPIKNLTSFIKILSAENPLDVFCSKNSFWHDTFKLPKNSDAIDIQKAICNDTDQTVLSKVIKDFKLSDFVKSFNDSAIKPDWKNIIEKSAKLAEMVQHLTTSLSLNSLLDFTSLFNQVTAAYNNTDDLWKMLSSLNELGETLKISPEIMNVTENYLRAGQLIVDWLNNLANQIISQGQHVDFGRLFQNSTMIQRLISVMKMLDSDMAAEELLLGVLRPEMIPELIKMVSNDPQSRWLCSESDWRRLFTFPKSFNVSTLVHALCGLNDTVLRNDLSKLLDIQSLAESLTKPADKKQDIQAFVTSVQQLSDNIMKLMNISSVEFKGLNLDKLVNINMTYILLKLQTQIMDLQSTYPQYAKSLEDWLTSMSHEPGQSNAIAFALYTINLYSRMLSQQLHEISSKPFNLTKMIYSNSLSDVFKIVLQHPEWMEELAQVQVDPKKFQDLLQAPDATTKLCGPELWNVMMPPQNSSTLIKLQTAMCDINQTVLMVESLSGFLANYTFGQQFQELLLEYSKGNLVYNASYVSAATSSMSELIQMLIKVISNPGNITITGTDNLVDQSSFSSIFKRVESILQQQYASQIVKWTTMLFGQIVPQDQTTMKAFKTVNVVMEVINKQLSSIKGTISLDSLVNDKYLEEMIKSFLNVNNLGTSALVSQEILISKVMELVQNMTLFQHLCKVQGLADFVTAPGKNSSVAMDLERIMCFYPDAFLQALKSQQDVQYLTEQLNNIWNNSVSQTVDWGKFSGNIENFTQLLTDLVQHQPNVDSGSWSSLLNFNLSLAAIESLFTDQDKLFSLIAGYNPLLNKDVEAALYPYLSMWNQIYKHMKTFYQDLQSFGCSYTEYPNIELKTSDGSPMIITGSNTETMEKCRFACERESPYSGTCVGFLYEPENGGSCILYMNDTLPGNVVKVSAWGKNYYERNCTGRDLHGTKKNSLLTMIKWFSSLESMVALTGGSSVRLMLEQVGQTPQIQTFVCTPNLLSSYVSSSSVGLMSSTICGQDPKTWYDRLKDAGFDTNYMDMLYRGITGYMKDKNIKDPRSITWAEFISQIQDVTKMFETMDFKDFSYRLGVSLETATTGQQTKDVIMGSLDWLKVLTDNIQSSQSMLNLLTSVNAYLNKQLARLQGAGKTVPITALLPNNTLVVNLLNETMGQQTAAALLTAYVAPDKFLELSFSDKWTTIVCDPVEFKKTFIFPNGTLVDKIQQDLCTEAQSQKSAVEDILKRLDMTDVIKALEDLMTGSSSTTLNNTYLWEMIKQNVEEFLTNVEHISGLNIDVKDIDKWLEAFKSLQSPSINSVEPVCEGMVTYMKNTDVYKHTIQPLMLGILNNLVVSKQQMKVQTAFEDILCDFSQYNVSQIARKLLDADFPELLKNLFQPNMNTSGTFQCSTFVREINDLSTLYTKMFTDMFNTTNNKWETCFKNLAKFPSKILNDASQTFLLASQLLEIMNDPTIKYLGQNSDLLPVMEFFLNTYLSQQETSFKISQILTNSTSVEEYLERVLRLSPEIVNSLFKSTLNLDTIALMNNSAETVTTIFCDPQQLDDVISLPGFMNISMVSLSKTLCGPNVGSTVQIVQSVVDIGTLSLMLSKESSKPDSGWWSVMSKHLSSVVKNFEMIGSLINFKFDFKNIDSVLPKLQRFIFDYGPEALADSINILLGDFLQLANTTESQMLVKDLQIIVNGLTSLKVVRNFIPQNVVLKDVMKNPAAFKKYMTENIGLDESVADAVLDGTIKYTYLLQYDFKDIEETFCNETRLAVFLNTTSPTVTLTNISTSLCGIGQDKVVNLTDYLLKTMDVGDLVKKYVTFGIDEFLKNINITKDDAQKAVQKLSSARADLLRVAEVFKNSSEDINLAIFNQPQALQGGQSMSSLSSLVCNINSSMSLGDAAGLSSKIQSTPTLNHEQEKEMMELPGKFCQDLYHEIQQSSSGPIIWKYLKPLIRGKIPFSPDTPETRLIIEKVNNDSFKILEEVRQVAQSWAEGTLGLNQLLKDNRTLHDIKELLSNGLVSGMITSVIGVPGSELVNSLYSLDDIDQSQMSALANIAELVANYTKCVETDRFTGFASEDDLVKEAVKLHQKNSFMAGIVFMNMDGGNRKKRSASTGFPKHISYKIRMDIENVRHTSKLKEMMWRPDPEDDMFAMRYTRGFIQLQDLIERSIINLQTGKPSHSPSVYLQQFPTPCHRNDKYLSYLSSYLLPVMMTIAWLAAIAVATKNFVYDREIGQEEALKIMGLKTYLNWWAWFISTMIIMFITSIFCLLILRFGNLFRYTDFGILLLYFMDFCFSSIMLCYMVSSFFTRTTLAMLTVLIVYLLSYLPYTVLVSMETQMTFWQKTLACLFSTSSFGFGAQYLSRFEVQGVGIHWSNIQSTPIAGDSASFSWACIMMLIDGFIYLVIGWYVRNVKPGKYGVAQPWYFPFSPNYWGCRSTTQSRYATSEGNDVLFEPPMENWRSGISLKGLSKNYGKFKAVRNINGDFYEGQVTALLGHNGAAKTTTLNMITGILDPTHGSVEIYGKENKGNKKIGICTQHNTLFNYMTVMEHMQFYSSIKSDKSGQKMKLEIEELLKDVELWHVRYVRASDLSGGMQRRLCVALAFVGGSEAVILDEPTSGVDPSGRRCIWNLIYRRKFRCTILLSTHHLDEADVIGDRVAIMHNGQLMCNGSPLFLKQQLGSGYQLRIVKRDNMDVSTVLSVIKTWISGAEITEDIGSEMTISLPLRGVPMDNLYRCLYDLDSNADHLHIGNYGIYDTTMEEVFHKVCTLADKNVPINEETVAEVRKNGNQDNDDELSDKTSETRSTNGSQTGFTGVDLRKRVGGMSHKFQQFTGLFIKRFHHYRRDWRMIISLIILPCVFVLTALGFISIRPQSPDATQLIMTPPLYGPSKYVFSRDGVGSTESQSLMSHLVRQPGIGTTCMSGMKLTDHFKCIIADTKFHTPANLKTSPGSCKCEDFQQHCDSAARMWEVPFRKTNTTDILQKLDGLDIEDFLIKTASQYREMRYGGWSFKPDKESQDTTLKATVWFNNKGHHAMPSFYNAFSNMLLRSSVNPANGDPSEYGITLYNHPMSLSKQQLNEDTLLESAADVGVALVFLVAFTFVPVGIIMYLVNEYKRKEKQLQFVSGVGPVMYWVTSFIWDALAFCLAVGLAVVIMAIFRGDSYWARDNLKAIVVLILLYGWATLPWMYCTVKIFKDATSAYMVLFTFNMFVGITTMVIAFVLNFFQNQSSLKSAYEVVKYLFLIFPPYSLGDGLVKLITNQIQANIFSQFGQDVYADPFSYDVLGLHLIALGIEGFVFAVLTFIIELRCSCKSRLPRSLEEEIYKEDEEVSNEKSRVLSGYAKDDLLTVSNLSKVYKRSGKEFLAVDHLTFGVPKAECFGLLGINGAGKTTTFRMLTGDILPSYGSAHLKGHRISRGKSNLGQEVGYCPQEDALDLYLTGRELLHCHARLRGLVPEAREQAVDAIISKLKMTYADKVIKTYSGGMRRNLMVAISLLGEPPVIFLDEPTTGMDPSTKRRVWNAIISSIKKGQSIVLTSHSMEECDTLCTRLAIMVNGEFKCLGSPQQLKDKYGDGYTVLLHMCGLSTTKHPVADFIHSSFPGSIIRDQYQGVLQIDIPKGSTNVGNIIYILEREKQNYNITHYSVSQTTLDNVFLNFAREQSDGTKLYDHDSWGRTPSGSGSDSGSGTYLSSPFTNSTYAFMNPGFDSKDFDKTKFGSEHPSKLMVGPEHIIVSEDDLVTKL